MATMDSHSLLSRALDQASASKSSTHTFETSLWFNAAIWAIELAAFTLLYKNFRSIYEPRTYLAPEHKRSNSIASSIFTWPIRVFRTDYRDVRRYNGMDAYFFVRFLRMMVKMLLPIWILSWAILMPVTSINENTGKSGLDIFSFGNISSSTQSRYAAHLICAWMFTFWIWYVLRSEMAHFVTARQQYFVDPAFAATSQANTVLVTGIPPHLVSERAVSNLFGHLPGGVKKVWIVRDMKELPDLYQRRLLASNKLEAAETKILKLATKSHAKQLKSAGKGEKIAGGETGLATLEALVEEKKRPSHKIKTGKLPAFLVGRKVDTITWAREEIATTTAELERGRTVLRDEMAFSRDNAAAKRSMVENIASKATSKIPGRRSTVDSARTDPASGEVMPPPRDASELSYPPLTSAFILFHNQAAAHMAAQLLAHHQPYAMVDREIGVAPEDVIWGNLGINSYERKVRTVISYAITAAIIIFWSIPVAFVGIVSNIANLCTTYSWLAWLCKIPGTVLGIIQGILPPVLLAVLMMLLPIILRKLGKFEGIPRTTGLELSLMTRYFIFQIIHSFLIVTIASGIIAALPDLVSNPTSIPTILAQNLPSASNFFLTYVILQGLSGSAAGFLQAVPLIVYYVKLFILGSTPRSVYNIKFQLRGVSWGTLFPAMTLITCITITYSVISPIINGLSCFTFFLFYQLYKYLFTYTFDQPASGDTGGLFFPKAIQHVFVGLYIQQVCLAALFFLARDDNSKASAIPEGALMVVLIIFTIGFHLVLNNSYGPLINYLPLSLAQHAHVADAEAGESINGGAAVGAHGTTGVGISPSSSANEKAALVDKHRVQHAERYPPTGQDVAAGPGAGAHANANYGRGPDASGHPAQNRVSPSGDVGAEDFYHPAAYEPQRIVWIPRDELGLSKGEVRANVEAGVDASDVDAVMNAKGKVDVDGPPPGEEL